MPQGIRTTDFKAHIIKRSKPNEKGCWIWQGALMSNGYGQMRYGARNSEGVHRVAYLEFIGPIAKGQVVRHTCDTVACVNPEHLVLGTQADNVKDMHERGRANHANAWGNLSCKV